VGTRLTGLAVIACGVALAAAPPATADSLVFIRDNNVWLSNPDGSGQYQVTLDGTASSPYESPSQSDGGVVMAVRQPPGGRRQLVRMSQSGALLNAPINTPAPGTGAIDARISPDGALVAYWFVTTVSDPSCAFCVNAVSQVLFSHPDRFTNYDEIGTPDTGGWPSWIGSSAVTVNTGSATQYFFRIGTDNTAQEWFTDPALTGLIRTLLDPEVAPTGDRLAVVEGDNQETIRIARMTGPPPAAPTLANSPCGGLAGPTGKFVDPTWSSDGRLLAWQEGDGIWTVGVPQALDSCTGFTTPPALRIPGATSPDLSPAANNPGARPGCGNPGNPAPCSNPCPTCGGCPGCGTGDNGAIKKALTALLASEAKTLEKLGIRGVLRTKGTRISYTSGRAGKLKVRLSGSTVKAHGSRAKVFATGSHSFASAGKARVALKLSKAGARALRQAARVRGSLSAAFTSSGGLAVTAKKSVTLKRPLRR
jgi:hypothetical protein